MTTRFKDKFAAQHLKADSLLCVGLDPELGRLPKALADLKNPFYEFNRAIIDATASVACSYKFQMAHYAAEGRETELKDSIVYLRKNHPGIPIILDGKRGDIGSTAERYAIECFERFEADAATVNPYMGGDSVMPFAKWADRGVFVLCRTSNPSAREIQDLRVGEKALFEVIADFATTTWNENQNIALVVGGTYPRDLSFLRERCGDQVLFLVPGVGAQGADIKDVVKSGQTANGSGLLINSSRAIIYASSGPDFAAAARRVADQTRIEINESRHLKVEH
jgi:orotidine-5'-phosphate decarboxylase